jgi:hypothetical protein
MRICFLFLSAMATVHGQTPATSPYAPSPTGVSAALAPATASPLATTESAPTTGPVASSPSTFTCPLCPDGSDPGNPNLEIPYYFINHQSITCGGLAAYAKENPNPDFCAKRQEQAGFCGCPGISPINACSFCPSGSAPARPDVVTPFNDTCANLAAYSSFLPAQTCNSSFFLDGIRSSAALCGCPGVESSCTLCDDKSAPPIPEKILPDNRTCAGLADLVFTLSGDKCLEYDRALEIGEYRCGCPTSSMPQCTIRLNPLLCTPELLTTTTADCECYNFCDGAFVSCSLFSSPSIEDLPSCAGTRIYGCNSAVAAPASSPSSGTASRRGPMLAVGALLAVVAWFDFK